MEGKQSWPISINYVGYCLFKILVVQTDREREGNHLAFCQERLVGFLLQVPLLILAVVYTSDVLSR